VSELKALHIMCKRDTESVKVAPESVLSNKVESQRYAFDRGEFAPGEVFDGEGYLWGGYLRTPVSTRYICLLLFSDLRRYMMWEEGRERGGP